MKLPILGHVPKHHAVDAGTNWVFGSGSAEFGAIQPHCYSKGEHKNKAETEIHEKTKDLNCERARCKFLPFPNPISHLLSLTEQPLPSAHSCLCCRKINTKKLYY